MALDEALLAAAPATAQPVLRFYGWTEPAASFGYSQRYTDIERLTALRPLVRRPTGGGLVPHDHDWTYSLTFPPTHPWYRLRARESYHRVHDWLRRAFAQAGLPTELAPCAHRLAPGQCFVGAEQSDLLWCGTKIAGAAQRRTHHGLLIQGSVRPPSGGPVRTAWEQALCEVARIEWRMRWEPFDLLPGLRTRAEDLAAQKYSRPEYNERR